MSISYPLRSAPKQHNNSTCASKLYSFTKKSEMPQAPKESLMKDTSIGPCEAFCDMSFEVPPGKAIDKVRKVFQILQNTLKLIDESTVIIHYCQTLQRTDHGCVAPLSIVLA